MRCCPIWFAAVAALGAAGLLAVGGSESRAQEAAADTAETLGALSIWDDGFAEISYYDATRTIYGQPRSYTRVQIVVREWFDPEAGVKTDDTSAASAVPVLKLNICEEIPTENYNYRLMQTLLAQRYTLAPLKLASSSQEWCGTSYKHLRWTGPDPGYHSFSYFEGEADQHWPLPDGAVPFETLLLKARERATAAGTTRLRVLPPMDSTHGVAPRPTDVTLTAGPGIDSLKTPAGTFRVRSVIIAGLAEPARLWIETDGAQRLIRYDLAGTRGTLRAVERRAYWDRNWKSSAHPVGEAP